MEPKIKLDDKIIINLNYKKRLSEKIKLVCSKIQVPYSNIEWYIYDPKSNNPIGNMLIGSNGENYGYCYPYEKKIYISTLAINRDKQTPIYEKSFNMRPFERKRDFLAEVIMDEIAHIVTGCNHGNSKYDTELERLRKLYYYGPIMI